MNTANDTPLDTMLRKIYDAIGEASTLRKPRPKGVFDVGRAWRLANDLHREILLTVPLSDPQTPILLSEAASEIRRLRQRNAILEAQVDTMEFAKALLYSAPGRSEQNAVQEDIAWKLEDRAKLLRQRPLNGGYK